MLRHHRGIRSVQQKYGVTFLAEGDFQDLRGVVENAEDADDRRRIDGFAKSFVVEADVAAGDGRAEGGAGFGEAVDGFAELPHHFGFFGAAEIEAIRGGDGPRAAAGYVAGRFRDGVHGANARIQLAPAAVAVRGERERALDDSCLRILDAHHCGVARSGPGQSICAHAGVVLLGDPALGGNRGRRKQFQKVLREIRAFGGKGKPICCSLIPRRGRSDGPPVHRTLFRQRVRGNFRCDFPVVIDAGDAAFGDLADDDGIEAPLLEDGEDFVLATFFGDQQHALLGFAEHDFVRGHAGFALGNFGEVDFDAGAAAGSHFHGGTSEAGGAHVLNRHDRAGLHGFEAGFEQQLLHKGVADLHVRALLFRLFGEFRGGEERGTVDAVAACFRADVDHGIANAFGFGEKDFLLFGNAERKGVDERILRIARLEGDFAANRRDTKTVSVASDSANYAVEDAAVFRGFFFTGVLVCSDLAESQGIQDSDGARAHGENVAQYAADAGGGALEGLDVAGMIVRFNFESSDQAVADVDDARVFARALHDEFAARGQALQMDFAGFVGAVLTPHHAENAQLGDIRLAAENLFHARVFFGGEAVFGGNLWSDSNFGASGGHISFL